MSLSLVFSDGDRFTSPGEADRVLADITDDIMDVQFPDSRRGLSRSRNEVNNRVNKFIQRCKVNQLNAVADEEKDIWVGLGKKAAMMRTQLDKAKDAILQLDKIW